VANELLGPFGFANFAVIEENGVVELANGASPGLTTCNAVEFLGHDLGSVKDGVSL
jgi:hypothetical protein